MARFIPTYTLPSDANEEDLAILGRLQGKPDLLGEIQNHCFLFGVTATLRSLDGGELAETVDANGDCSLAEPLPTLIPFFGTVGDVLSHKRGDS